MRGLLVAIALGVLPGGAALAQSCDDETIDAVATDGSVIKMRSGARFHVDSSDRIDASLWSPLDDVLICKDETEIVNKDRDGERVTVRRLQRSPYPEGSPCRTNMVRQRAGEGSRLHCLSN